jgi:hypothetical protein
VADIRAALASLGLDPETVDPQVLRVLEQASAEQQVDTRQHTPRKPTDRDTIRRRTWLRRAGAGASHGDVEELLEALPAEVHAEVRRIAADAAEARRAGAQHATTLDCADRAEALEPRLPPEWKPPKVDRAEVAAISDRIPRP